MGLSTDAANPNLLDVRRIDHQQEFLIAEAVDQQIVHDTARLVRKTGILHLTRYESIDIIGSDPLKKGARTRSFDDEFAHVGNVKIPAFSRTAKCSALSPSY